MKNMKKEIFLDHASTTPIARKIINGLIKNFKYYANPSSKHFLGEKIKEKIEKVRIEIAKMIHCDPEEIFFTSGGTEGNNLIIKGIAEKIPEKKHILVSSIEHSSVLESCEYLEKKGYRIDKISINKEGIVNVNEIESRITSDTLLVSVMHVNNEIGTIQPIEKISNICKKKGVFFHSDMVQSLGKLDINLKKINLDFASFSGHKINAPKGVGFIYIKRGVEINPIIHGGQQEKGVRSGTENFLGIISLPIALKLKRNKKSIEQSRNRLLKKILLIPGTRLNGSLKERIYNNINVSFYGIEGESLMMLLSKQGICVSTGSACSSHKLAESHVLKALELNPLYLNGAIRITLDKLSLREEKFILESLNTNVKKLQKISPFKFENDSQLKSGGKN